MQKAVAHKQTDGQTHRQKTKLIGSFAARLNSLPRHIYISIHYA